MDPLKRLQVDRVINASGRMTRLGVNTLSDEVLDAMAIGARNYLDIDELHRRVGEEIARLLGAEAAMVTTGAAAGVSLMVAACVAGEDLTRVQALPDPRGTPNRILIQAGHQVNFGALIEQMIRLAGGEPTPVGAVNGVQPAHLSGMIGPDVAGFLFVQSHHAVQKGMLDLATCIEICHERGVPVLVDAAAEEDLARYTGSGADLVTFSGGKAIGGPTSGIVAGRADLVRACRAQNAGIGRPMKVGKEQMLGLYAALERYLGRDERSEAARCEALVDRLLDGFSACDGVRTTRLQDEAGRGIERAGIVLDAVQARQLVDFLTSGSPAIYPRTHLVDTGVVAFDPRPLDDTDVDVIIERVSAYFDSGGQNHG
jgi:D-glucosaminate-6-phosphate ammonia-lyase